MDNPVRALYDWLRGEDLKRLPSWADDPAEQRLYRPDGKVLQRLEAQPVDHKQLTGYGTLGHPPGYSPLTGFSFTPGSYPGTNGPMSASDAIRLGVLISGPGAGDMYRQAQGYVYDGNSAVFACLQAICTAYGEAPPRTYKGDAEGGQPTPVPDHPLEELLAQPNPFIPAPHMWYGAQYAKHASGDAYWVKVRSDATNVVELWPMNPLVFWPVTTEEDARAGTFISYYNHEYAQGKYRPFRVEDVIHFRMGLHPNDPRHGCSPLQHLVREVAGDEEATNFTAALLANGAIPGLLVTIPPEQSRGFTEEKANELKARIEASFRAGNRGRVGVLTNGGKMEQFGFSPDQLNLQALHNVPETRVCAVMRTPVQIVGLGAGTNSPYANVRELRHAFTDSALVPLYTFDAATLNLQLVPDFAPKRRVFVKFDLNQIRALQEDENQRWARYDNAIKTGWITPNEARKGVGLPEVDWGDEPLVGAPTPTPAPVLPVGADKRQNGSSNIVMNPSPSTAGSAR